MNLPHTTIAYGIILIVVGIIGYVVTGMASITALIPALLGIVILVSGVLAQKESRRKHFMHVAAILGLFGFFGTMNALPSLFSMIGGEEIARPAAVISKSVTSLLSLIFVVLCVKSFIDVRRQQAA